MVAGAGGAVGVVAAVGAVRRRAGVRCVVVGCLVRSGGVSGRAFVELLRRHVPEVCTPISEIERLVVSRFRDCLAPPECEVHESQYVAGARVVR